MMVSASRSPLLLLTVPLFFVAYFVLSSLRHAELSLSTTHDGSDAAMAFRPTSAESSLAARASTTKTVSVNSGQPQQQHATNATHWSEMPPAHAHASKILPIRNETGVIMIYLHTPKTGGTTIRKLFNPYGKVFFGWGKQKYEQYARQLSNMIEDWKPGQLAFFELHGGDAPSYLEFHSQLRTWRTAAQAKGIPFFAFTVVREPVSFSVSAFAYYHTQFLGGFKVVKNPTEQNFIDMTLPNQQCLFLARTEDAYRENCKDRICGEPLRRDFEKNECDTAYESFLQDMDWVGVTEKMSDETLPLLAAVADRPLDLAKTQNHSRKKLSQSDLSQSTLDWVANITQWDKEIYERAARDFPIAMWKNFPTTTTTSNSRSTR